MSAIAELTPTILADGNFPVLRDYVIAATGLEYYVSRPSTFAEQVAHRMTDLGFSDCSSYLKLLHDENIGETELDKLIVRLSIGETHFFRHRELFDALRDVALPAILEQNRTSKRLRIWSAGCSTGAEAYSLSVLLRREMQCAFKDWNISIIGTDINRPFLSQSTAGRYEDWAFRGTTAELRRTCFEEEQNGRSWRILPRFQEGVTFHYHNLVRHPFPSLAHNLVAFDIILCRNVLIYFAPDVAQRTISQLAECLVPGGWLAVGHAENSGMFCDKFETLNLVGATLHRKLPTTRANEPNHSDRRLPRPKSPHRKPTYAQSADLSGLLAGPYCHTRGEDSLRRKPQASSENLGIKRIKSLADQGDVDSALELSRALIAKEPLNSPLHFYSGLLLDQAAQPHAAAEALGRAIQLDHDFVIAHYYLALVQQKVANDLAAAASFRNVMQLLEGLEQSAPLPNADGLKVADLFQLTSMHVETLKIT